MKGTAEQILGPPNFRGHRHLTQHQQKCPVNIDIGKNKMSYKCMLRNNKSDMIPKIYKPC
jgi:hypothetical protein